MRNETTKLGQGVAENAHLQTEVFMKKFSLSDKKGHLENATPEMAGRKKRCKYYHPTKT